MNINKAIRKQKKSIKRFMLSMGFIFILLPTVAYVSKISSWFLIIYLILIEIFIIVAILIRLNRETLKFEYGSRLKIQNGILGEGYSIDCNKVKAVHSINRGKALEIIVILKSRFRNKNIKKVDSNFLKDNNWANIYFNDTKENSKTEYYYIIIDKGGYIKYKFLDLLYRNCIKADFTEEAIKRIKEYRIKE
ncbi:MULTISPECIES: hypothetical protein [Clostridium]|uniref:Uncharacterized protein n=2 Tax=Clostridium TaxID=1485 RepID=A0A151AP25_9CLOT|nr:MULTISPECIES: hypothetical protein [Clostridium]KYH29394.1 hypothetical protein CLCOL_11420 [Clostridium colicanis DSM 13634]MBE6044070.1 hypothetical protein [Clostridium thermopalmarium]PRR70824.1 hypothetical protein CPAL_19090 [Clostridium thermopalmarium DSM 5974]PVZ28748.1 hypothetical protein LX19_00045 [Clostridium thermopalmarium DSM 5974]